MCYLLLLCRHGQYFRIRWIPEAMEVCVRAHINFKTGLTLNGPKTLTGGISAVSPSRVNV